MFRGLPTNSSNSPRSATEPSFIPQKLGDGSDGEISELNEVFQWMLEEDSKEPGRDLIV